MLQIKKLTVSLNKDLRTIIDDFTFTLNPGDKAVIIGEEGNGKSTLLKLIYDPELVSDYVSYEGEIITHNTRFGYLAQDMAEDVKTLTVSDYTAMIDGFYDQSPKELASVTRSLSLPGGFLYSDQIIGTLSGGERVKLQIAKILIEQPDVLLLDEPSNDIDIETLEWLEDFINGCEQPVLFVSHDETLIENTANVVVHIEQVRRKTLCRATVARMPYRQYIESRTSALAHQEQSARKEKAEYDAKMKRFSQIQQKVNHELNSISRGDPHGGQLLKKKMKAVKSMERRFERESEDMTMLPDIEEAIFIRFDDDVRMPNGKTVLELELPELTVDGTILARDIRLNVTGAEKVAIIGRNGVGKSTLLRVICEMLLSRSDINAAYMPQNYEDLLDYSATPVDFLSVSYEKEETTKIRTFLGSMKYTADEMGHAISELSGGQRAKLLFLKMILGGANVLILDEPTRNFSPMSNPVIRDVLASFGGTIISISHDRKYIDEVCTKVYRLTEDGLISERG